MNRKIIVVVLMVVATSILLLPLLRNHELAHRLVCGRNIKMIGSALRIYANNFLGSGTSVLAAVRARRRCVGLELDPAWCDVLVERWESYTGEKAERVAP